MQIRCLIMVKSYDAICYFIDITKAKCTLHCGLAITIVFVGELALFRYTFLDMASLSVTHIDTKFSQIYSLLNI